MNLTLEVDNFEYKTIEEYVFAQIQRYIGKTQLEIFEHLTGKQYETAIPKNISKMISDKTIGKDNELKEKDDLFQKTNYIIKNLPVNKEGYPLERMAFRNLRLSEFEDEWEESNWKAYFEEVTIIVLCYEGSKGVKN